MEIPKNTLELSKELDKHIAMFYENNNLERML